MDFDAETQAKLEKSMYAQAVASAIIHLGKTVELVMNLRDLAVLTEMERLCCSVFEQARAALWMKGRFNEGPGHLPSLEGPMLGNRDGMHSPGNCVFK